jgi:beta-lactamase regulating signal transducer with metallopeptidase domain
LTSLPVVFLGAALKATVLLALVSLAARAWHRASAARLHLLWSVALVSVWVMPIMGWLLPAWPVASLSDTPDHITLSARSLLVLQALPEASSINFSSALLFELWGVGALCVLLPMILGFWQLSRYATGASIIPAARWDMLTKDVVGEFELTDRVRVLRSDTCRMPMSWGIFRPVILIPACTARWPVQQRRDILAHELAHVKRRDALTDLLARFACVVFWFNPLVWMAFNRLRVNRERACDDWVLRTGTRPSMYARHLVDVARIVRRDRSKPLFALPLAEGSQLRVRLEAILNVAQCRARVSTAAVSAVWVIMLCSTVPIATATLRDFVVTPASQANQLANSAASALVSTQAEQVSRSSLETPLLAQEERAPALAGDTARRASFVARARFTAAYLSPLRRSY